MRVRKKTYSATIHLEFLAAAAPAVIGEKLADIADVLLQDGYEPDYSTTEVSPEVEHIKDDSGDIVGEYRSLYLTMEGVAVE